MLGNLVKTKDLFSPEVKGGKEDVVDFVKNIQAKVNAQEGNYTSGICIQ